MILFLELAISKLDRSKKQMILSKMEDDLKQSYKKFKPVKLIPSEALIEGALSTNAIITGVPKLTASKTDFNGFIMIPVMTGKVTTFTMIPLIDQYDVYELKDEMTSESFTIAHVIKKEKLPERKIKVAGVFKELKTGMDKRSHSKMFLEALYYSDIS